MMARTDDPTHIKMAAPFRPRLTATPMDQGRGKLLRCAETFTSVRLGRTCTLKLSNMLGTQKGDSRESP